MHGVPETLDLSVFHGAVLEQVCLGEFYLQFRFRSLVGETLEIGIESGWRLQDGAGAIVDEAIPNSERSDYKLHRLFGHEVTATCVDAPRSFSLRFASGDTLTICDDSTEYESFSIQPGNIFV